jgi:hypothetical protein
MTAHRGLAASHTHVRGATSPLAVPHCHPAATRAFLCRMLLYLSDQAPMPTNSFDTSPVLVTHNECTFRASWIAIFSTVMLHSPNICEFPCACSAAYLIHDQEVPSRTDDHGAGC